MACTERHFCIFRPLASSIQLAQAYIALYATFDTADATLLKNFSVRSNVRFHIRCVMSVESSARPIGSWQSIVGDRLASSWRL